MSVSKDIIKECMHDLRDTIMDAHIIRRDVTFEEKGCYVLVGVRHAGKSYLLYQRIHELLKSGHTWEEFICLDFDDERLMEFEVSDFNKLLEIHYELSDSKPIFFLDEVQRIPGWELFARRLADQKQIVYLTGSNAKALSADIATTLGGRYFIQDVYPYSFREYLRAHNMFLPRGLHLSTKTRSIFLRVFNEYMQYGGLPEILQFQQKRSRLSSLYQKIYLGDICTRHKVQNAHALSIMLKKMAESVRQPISYNRLSHIIATTGIKTSIPTIIDYVDYAMESWLVIPAQNYVAKLADKESNKKYYFVDNGLMNLFLSHQEPAALENIVAMHLCRIYGKDSVCYFQNNEHEIDFIVPEEQLAIQVSYSLEDMDVQERELKPLYLFQSSHPDWKCLLITYDTSAEYSYHGMTFQSIPAWEWSGVSVYE